MKLSNRTSLRRSPRKLPQFSSDVAGVNLKRKHIFLGRWIRRGGRYPRVLLRLWRRGRASAQNRWMDEHICVESDNIITLDGGIADCNLNDLNHFTDKHNRYASREAVQVVFGRHGAFIGDEVDRYAITARQAAVKRVLKDHIYGIIPFQIAALSYFRYRYIIRLGFLDGQEGLICHVSQGFWYRFLVGAKSWNSNARWGTSRIRAR